jgi:hypothetical protein
LKLEQRLPVTIPDGFEHGFQPLPPAVSNRRGRHVLKEMTFDLQTTDRAYRDNFSNQ